MVVYKIVKGNGFWLHVLVDKVDMSKDFKRLIPCDMSLATDIKVTLSGFCYDDVELVPDVDGIFHNELSCKVPSDLETGTYDVTVSWKLNGTDMSSTERNFLAIVDHNSKVRLPIGVTDGETSGMFNIRYFIVTENQSMCAIQKVLDHVSIDNEAVSLVNGKPYNATLTGEDGYGIGVVKVVMSGEDITEKVYKDGKISIPAVSGYVMIVAFGDGERFFYGASSASLVKDLNLSDLTAENGSIVGKTLNVTTTDDKRYVWFVSRVPVDFTQAGFEALLNHQELGDFHYYWSDELVAGDDNIYTAKLR